MLVSRLSLRDTMKELIFKKKHINYLAISDEMTQSKQTFFKIGHIYQQHKELIKCH